MKPAIVRKVVVVASLCVGQLAHAENSSIVGTFDGIIWSNYEKAGITEFYLMTEQDIEARYVFTHSDIESEGHLNTCNLKEFVLLCIWNDKIRKR